jgi:hypothetical protein
VYGKFVLAVLEANDAQQELRHDQAEGHQAEEEGAERWLEGQRDVCGQEQVIQYTFLSPIDMVLCAAESDFRKKDSFLSNSPRYSKMLLAQQ